MAPFGCRIIVGSSRAIRRCVAVEALNLDCVFGYSAVARARRAAGFLTAVASVFTATTRRAPLVGAVIAAAVSVFVTVDLTRVGRAVVAVLAAARVRGPVVPAAFAAVAARGVLVVVLAAAAPAAAAAARAEIGVPVGLGSFTVPATTSLKYLPGRNTGTVVFFTLTTWPVRGLRAARAARCRFSNTPNPAMVTF